MARIGHALSDATRARILLALRDGPRFPADLADELGVSRQSMSNHLTCLRGCSLVLGERHGRHVAYSLSHPAMAHLIDDVVTLTRDLDPGCCVGDTCECA